MSDPLSALRAAFVERCREDLGRLGEASPDEASFASIAHRLAGAAGSFGFPELSEAAAAVDHSLRKGEPPTAAQTEALMRRLGQAAGAAD